MALGPNGPVAFGPPGPPGQDGVPGLPVSVFILFDSVFGVELNRLGDQEVKMLIVCAYPVCCFRALLVLLGQLVNLDPEERR